MGEALALARSAAQQGEVPVGAVVVYQNEIVGRGANAVIEQQDPSAHAEMLAIRQAATQLNNYRLNDTTLYVTLEPCVMCAGAILHARVERVVFAAHDQRWGAGGSVANVLDSPLLNHSCAVESGVLMAESQALLQNFFAGKR